MTVEKINIYAFADEASADIDEQIKALKRNSLDGLEIRNVDGTNISDITEQKAKEVRAKLDSAGLNVWSLGSPIGKIGINDDFPSHIEKFKHTLFIGNILGAKNMRIFSFFIDKSENYDGYKNEVIDRLGTLCELSAGSGIALCHENEKGIFGDTAKRCLELFKNLPDLKGIFDPANFVQSGEDTLKAWDILKDYIKYLHIKDSMSDMSVVPAGKGEGNVFDIIKYYTEKGGKDMTLEPHLAVFDGLSALENKGEDSKIGQIFTYKDNSEAFDAGANALKELIANL